MCRSLDGMAKNQPELDNKEKRAVKEWQGETSRKVTRTFLHVLHVFGTFVFSQSVPVMKVPIN